MIVTPGTVVVGALTIVTKLAVLRPVPPGERFAAVVTGGRPAVTYRGKVFTKELDTGEDPIAVTSGSPASYFFLVDLLGEGSGSVRRPARATVALDTYRPGVVRPTGITNGDTVVASDVVPLALRLS